MRNDGFRFADPPQFRLPDCFADSQPDGQHGRAISQQRANEPPKSVSSLLWTRSFKGEQMTPFELPPPMGKTENIRFEDIRSMVILGANGSGKSRLGARIEQLSGNHAHRFSAQRALTVPDYVQPRTHEQAESTLLYGQFNPNQSAAWHAETRTGSRWGNEPANRMLNDFDQVLELLFADEAKRDRDYTRSAFQVPPADTPPKCKLDKLLEIWAEVMPQRTLSLHNNRVRAATNGRNYEARQMSDGERVTLYLIGQSLCAPADVLVIIDEPEIHLHRAIQGLLWDLIEKSRPDCTFIYITHDLEFAATRTGARRIWLKEFDGTDWIWEDVPSAFALPDSLLYQLLGNRRPLIFVEGDENSYDSAI
jgi:AAA domain, putative AbiEii toxin, Type IV TA system